MNCEKTKELILTDYIDNEISEKDKIRLNIHFADCQECQGFFEIVKRTVVKPFANLKKVEPPELIWERIKEAIVAKQQENPIFVFHIPRPVLAMSTMMALVLIFALAAALRFGNRGVSSANREDQAEFSTYSIESPVSESLNNGAGFGTSIEDSFL